MDKKLTYSLIIGILIISSLLYFAFIYDIGLNSDYFVKRDFNEAFLLRKTGNCDRFGQFIIENYSKEWFNRCLDEKNNRNVIFPIKDFVLKEASFNNNQVFLQVELTRDIPIALKIEEKIEKSDYVVNYEMKRTTDNKKFLGILPQTRFLINQGINR